MDSATLQKEVLISRKGITIPEIIRERALTESDTPLFTFISYGRVPDEPLTLKDLNRGASIIAQELHHKGIKDGRVILLYLPGVEFIKAFIACLYAGVTAIPVHPGRGMLQGRGQLKQIMEHTRCSAILMSGPQVAKALETMLHENISPKTLLIDTSTLDQTTLADEWPLSNSSPNDQAYIQYTSGSSGMPKGVSISHFNILSNLQAVQKRLQFIPSDVALCWLPMNHDMGLIGNILSHVVYGARPMYLMSPLSFIVNPLRWLQSITLHKVTITGGPNFAYDLCIQKIKDDDLATLDLTSWSVAYCGAEPARFHTLKKFAQRFKLCGFDERSFCPGYGLAESTLVVTSTQRSAGITSLAVNSADLLSGIVSTEGQPTTNIVSCGSVVDEHEILIVDPEGREILGEKKVGEIWIQGPSVSKGYFQTTPNKVGTFGNSHPLTKKGSYLRSGDLGFLFDGNLYVTGRLKDAIIIRGRTFMPDSLECTATEASDKLQGAVATALPLVRESTEALLLVIEASTALEQAIINNTEVGDELHDQVRKEILETHDVDISELAFVKFSNIPKTTSGKVKRKQCLEDYQQGRLSLIYRRCN